MEGLARDGFSVGYTRNTEMGAEVMSHGYRNGTVKQMMLIFVVQ